MSSYALMWSGVPASGIVFVAVAVSTRAVSVFSVIVVGAVVYVRSDSGERVGAR